MRKRNTWAVLLLLLMLLLHGCSAGGSSKSAGMGAAPAEAPAPPMVTGGVEYQNVVVDKAGNAVASTADKGGAGVATPADDRKRIFNASIELKVKEVDETIASISHMVRAAGGYVQENRVEGTRQNGRRVNMSVRVPSLSYGSILETVAGLGEQINLREWTQDVTEEYLDLDARIRTKEVHLAQLQKLYQQGGSIRELMELEQEIARVTADLESIKGRFNFLSNQVAFSTISISLFEPGVPTPTKDPQNLWERMRNGFVFSWNSMIDLGGDLLILVASLIPRLLFLSVLGGIVWAVVVIVKKRRSNRNTDKAA